MSDKDTEQERAPYILQRSYRSSNRLNFNHWLIKECCGGYLLHPKIDQLKEGARIADVACGTAIWSLETAASLPDSVKLDGFDISPAQFPPKTWTPGNVHLTVHDFYERWPEQYRGKYDIVHAQLLVCMINDGDAEKVLGNMVELLKPGGYIQWLEPDVKNQKVIVPEGMEGKVSTKHCETLNQMMLKPRPSSSYNWLSNIPQLFENCGLTLEAYEQVPLKKHLRLMYGQSTLAGIEDVIPDMKKTGKLSGGSPLEELVPGLIGEFEQGVVVDHPWQVMVGRKRR